MTKAKKTKVPQQRTELDRIVTQLRTVLRRRTSDVVLAGNLLIKARKLFANEHGEWQPWLTENFDLGYHTARNYMAAAEYVARQKLNGSIFGNLAPTVLYRLADGGYTDQEEAEILAQAKAGKRIDQDRAFEICEKLAPPDDADDAADVQDDDGDDGGDENAEEDAESKAIIDGLPPTPPAGSSENLAPPDYAARDFDQAIGTLKRLMTKSAAQFGDTGHTVEDLKKVRDFIRAVADELSKLAEAS